MFREDIDGKMNMNEWMNFYKDEYFYANGIVNIQDFLQVFQDSGIGNMEDNILDWYKLSRGWTPLAKIRYRGDKLSRTQNKETKLRWKAGWLLSVNIQQIYK